MKGDRDIQADYMRVMNKAHAIGEHVFMTGHGDQLGNVSIRCSDGKIRRGHVIVWEMHANREAPIGMYVVRKCETQGCIRHEHLELITPQERENRKKKKFAEMSQLEREVREANRIRVEHDGLGPDEVRGIYFDPRSYNKLAEAYGISRTTVYKIKKGKIWAHTTGHVQEGEVEPRRDHRQKLTDEQVIAIREDTRPARKVAADYGVSHVTVYRIKNFLERINVSY